MLWLKHVWIGPKGVSRNRQKRVRVTHLFKIGNEGRFRSATSKIRALQSPPHPNFHSFQHHALTLFGRASGGASGERCWAHCKVHRVALLDCHQGPHAIAPNSDHPMELPRNQRRANSSGIHRVDWRCVVCEQKGHSTHAIF
eukprot:1146449-Pelagomonas_calceolata.AAC.7